VKISSWKMQVQTGHGVVGVLVYSDSSHENGRT